jgi:hypothetical protein
MNIATAIKSFFQPKEYTLAELATGLCVLPMPRQKPEQIKKQKAADLYVIDRDRNEFGFHFASASRQNEGSIAELTAYDVRLLKARGYWGKGADVQAKNAGCKLAWHNGRTEGECAVSLGVSESWVEKRYGTFATALLEEIGDGV